MVKSGNVREGRSETGRSLADNAVRRRTGICKQIFGYAIDLGWIEKNSFKGTARAL